MAYWETFPWNWLEERLNKDPINISWTPEQIQTSRDTAKETNQVKAWVPYEKAKLTLSNNSLLEIPKGERLSYVTKNYISWDSLSQQLWKTWDDLKDNPFSLTFSFNEKENSELFMKTTAGQVLPREVYSVVSNNVTYIRKSLDWEFFAENNSRLIIKDNTKILISEVREIWDIVVANTESRDEYLKNNPDLKWKEDIVLEAINRWIDPRLALLVSWENSNIESRLTEFGRQRSYLQDSWDTNTEWRHGIELVIGLLKMFAPDNWKNLAQDYWFWENEVKSYVSENVATKLSLWERKDILNKAPDYLKVLVKKYFPPEEFENAILVCSGESGFDKNAINKNSDKHLSTDRWLFQINDHYHSNRYKWENIFDPETNVRIAWEIFRERQARLPEKAWKDWYAAEKIWLWGRA